MKNALLTTYRPPAHTLGNEDSLMPTVPNSMGNVLQIVRGHTGVRFWKRPQQFGWGDQIVVRFPNGYGASLLNGGIFTANALCELGVLIWEAPTSPDDEARLCCEYHSSGDVYRCNTASDVIEHLKAISAKPSRFPPDNSPSTQPAPPIQLVDEKPQKL